MPELQVVISLPYLLRLRAEAYSTAPAGEAVLVRQEPGPEGSIARTTAAPTFLHPETADPSEKQGFRLQDAERLLRRTNRLLRWYRAVSHQAEVIELTRAQASPFLFEIIGAGSTEGWTEPLEFDAAAPPPLSLSIDNLSNAVRDGLAGGGEPEVPDLFLFDAERALHQGRFREAVLFCWSTIDSSFNRKYDALVNVALAGEWAESRDFFTGPDFGLRNKMSAVMHLVAHRSLFREPDGLWEKLSASYRKRNAIIHRGENATEDDARLALEVASRIIAVMGGL